MTLLNQQLHQRLHQKLRLLGEAVEEEQKDIEEAIRAFQRRRGLPPTGKADPHTRRAIDEAVKALPSRDFRVGGTIVSREDKEMRPLVGVTVRAFDKDLRSEELLGQARTDARGHYEITYTSKQFARAEKASADLVLHAFSPEGALLAASDPVFNAANEETVDLEVVPREAPDRPEPSEYEQLLAELDPLLDGVLLADLTGEDIEFLVRETGLEPDDIKLLVEAAGLAEAVNLPGEVFYGLGRRALPLELEALRDRDASELRSALQETITENIIPAALEESLDDIIGRLKEPVAEEVLREPVQQEFVGRLLEKETEEPLSGYTVRAFDLESGDEPTALGYDIADANGAFAFVYRIFRERVAARSGRAAGESETKQEDIDKTLVIGETDQTEHRLRLEILDPQGEQVDTVIVRVRPDQKEVEKVFLSVPAAPERPSSSIDELASAVSLELPGELRSLLREHGIQQLEDIRRAGGLRHLNGLQEDDQERTGLGRLVRRLIRRRRGREREDGPVQAAIVRLEAHATLSVLSADVQLNDRLIERGYADMASIASTPRAHFVSGLREELGDFRAAQLHTKACAQHAYLDNISAHVRADIANGWQPAFGDDRLRDVFSRSCGCEDCEAAVSPLAYLADLLDYTLDHLTRNGNPVDLQYLTDTFHQPFGLLPASCGAVDKKVRQVRLCIEVLRYYLHALGRGPAPDEEDYRWAAYTALLTRIGTSYAELRQARGMDQEERGRQAERLGILPNRVDALRIDRAALTEADLEALFGLVDTDPNRRDPLADGQQPDLERWKLEYLRSLWQAEDWPEDVPSGGRTLIDPDLIGPDDFRLPRTTAMQRRAFEIWQQRRTWIDAALDDLYSAQLTRVVHTERVRDIDAWFAFMYRPVLYRTFDNRRAQFTPWANTQPGDFSGIADLLSNGSEEEVERARRTLEDDLHLRAEGFSRLMEIWRKFRLWTDNAANEPVAEEEWHKLRSILVQAMKAGFFDAWRDEERRAQLRFGPELFWFSVREPTEGEWPPVREPLREDPRRSVPLIDPEVVGVNDLPEPLDSRARVLWERRRDQLADGKRRLRAAREDQSLQAMLELALGDPNNNNVLPHDLDNLLERLDDIDPAVVGRAESDVAELHLTVEQFRRLMEIGEKDAASRSQNSNQLPPTASEWDEVYTILLTARKELQWYPGWYDEEVDRNTGIVYWQALKARLPRWRGDADARRQWQEALKIRSRPPLVDPDVIEPGDFVRPQTGEPAFELWTQRQNVLETRQNQLRVDREGERDPRVGLDRIMQDVSGLTSQVLEDLAGYEQTGNDTTARLAQLHLARQEFIHLRKVRQLAAAGEQVLDEEWEDVYAILVTMEKRRRTAEWRDAEEQAGLTLRPALFRLQQQAPEVFLDPPPGSRSDRKARRDWQDRLAARIEQQENVRTGLLDAVSTVEEETLPVLRDMLVTNTGAAGTTLPERAKQLAGRLLIDMQVDGCDETTRISQAITTLQGLLWSVRTGQLQGTYPGLVIDDDTFDEKWQWIGSYATWRGKMFVFLYPENLLLPGLRFQQTPAFRRLLRDVRANNRLTPEQACEAAKAYEAYFRDVCHLEVEASCQARTRLHRGTCRDRSDADYGGLFYTFARGGETNTVYWSAYDPEDETGYAQTLWTPIERFQNTIKLIGAVPYERSPEHRHIYLFAIVDDEGEQKLAFIRYDLEQQRMDAEPTVLEDMPEEAVTFTAVAKQHQRAGSPPHVAVRVPGGAIYDRRLDREGSDWAGDEWRQLIGKKQGDKYTALHAIVESSENSFLLFVTDRAGRLLYKEFTEGLLELKPGPTAARGPLLFMRGSDQALHSNTWNQRNAVWEGWQSLGGFLTSDPAAVTAFGSNTFGMPAFLFAAGRNGELYYASMDQTPLQWDSLQLTDVGVTTAWRPSVVFAKSHNFDGFVDVFVRGSDSALWHRRYSLAYDRANRTWPPGSWGNWHRLGSSVSSAPVASPFGPDFIDLFALNADGELLRMEYEPARGRIMQTVSLGGTWTSDAAVIPPLQGWRFVFIRGEENSLHYFRYHRYQGSQTTEWRELEGEFASAPAGITQGQVMHIFARGRDDEIWHGRMQVENLTDIEGHTWLGWQTMQDGTLHGGDDQGWADLGTGTFLGAFQWAQSDEVYAFWRDSIDASRYAVIAPQQGVQGGSPGQSWLESVGVHAGGSTSDDVTRLAYTRWRPSIPGWVPYRYRSSFRRAGNDLIEHETTPIAPRIVSKDASGRPQTPDPLRITEKMEAGQLQGRRLQLANLFGEADSMSWPASIRTYIEEAYYFVPVHLALELQRRGQFIAALDWFRNVYDYSRSRSQRKIYHRLEREQSLSAAYERGADWLLDRLNPHAIASTRANTYTRFTLLSLVRCFLEYADAEFTRDTRESVTRAYMLYQTARELLALPEMNQQLGLCRDIIGNLEIEVGTVIAANAPVWRSRWEAVVAELSEIRDSQLLRTTVDEIRNVLNDGRSWEERFAAVQPVIDRARSKQTAQVTVGALLEEQPSQSTRISLQLLAQPEVFETAIRLSTVAGTDFLQAVSRASGIDERTLTTENVELPWLRHPVEVAGDGSESVASRPSTAGNGFSLEATDGQVRNGLIQRAAPSWGSVQSARRIPKISPEGPRSYSFCIPPNPVVQALRLHAELNLFKLRTCRNIAGMERQLEPYAAPTDTESGLPQIGAGGQLVLPGTNVLQPTPYRYQVLIERAKQLVQLAAQIEAAMLAALEKRDAEYYNLLQARQNVELSRAGIRLQDLRIREAESGVKLAELQRDRAQMQVDTYQDWLGAGINAWEQEMISAYQLASAARIRATWIDVMVQTYQALTTALTGSWGIGAALANAAAVGAFSALRADALAAAISAETRAQIASIYASYERRAQEWEFQKNLAEQDIRIGTQQVKIAEDHVRVVGQERNIAELQHDHAKETVDFLANKFTNVELYDWMSGVLEGVYSFFLQQATAMARLAENQVAFERQTTPPAYIQADYWEAPVGLEAGMDGEAPDRRGLTGSARLLQDIYQLDQHAFETDRRKLQLAKTISLARLDPYAFQRFRETGVLPFDTLMVLFDRDFPGHYLRLIKRVRLSVIALVPPVDGIKATLINSGLSRVVIGSSGLFGETIVRRPPESVALSSPNNATGLFELTPENPDMLLPFEGLGVDTNWELRMPRASNFFDYTTIADVLITIEYTALDSFDYRQQVVQELDRSISADRPFSFRHQFSDAWYDLHNPELTDTPMTVRFESRREDFPPNVDELRIQHVLLYFARSDGATFEIPVTHLHLIEPSGGSVGGGATTVDGVISTRRGNAGSWTAMLGKPVAGQWELALPNTTEIRNRFKDEQIEDILFVITYRGQAPEWPV